jgi:AmmeMemoRadiSam system protein B
MGIGAIIEVAKKRGWKSSDIKYTTSFDRSKDASSVVGYASALFS